MHPPIELAEFAGWMERWGPFGAERRVVVGVSGGADSMALAWLLKGWGEPLAVVVDHGLRAASAEEAGATMERLGRLGIAARLVSLRELRAGADLGARARAARYGVLLAACREAGRPDLFVAHHAQDQAETVLLRRARGSGVAGLAAMAAVSWRGDARVLRPLLGIMPERLRSTLIGAGIGWVEDPSNHDPGSARGALRGRGLDLVAPLDEAARAGVARREREREIARELGRGVSIHPTGHAVVRGALSPAAWSALIWSLSGRDYPPSPGAVARLVAAGDGTLHGVMVRAGVVAREPAALGAPVSAMTGAVWDGRFVVRAEVAGGMLGGMGGDVQRLRRRRRLPSRVMETLPLVRVGTELLTSAHLDYLGDGSWPSVQVDFRPTRAVAGAPFLPA